MKYFKQNSLSNPFRHEILVYLFYHLHIVSSFACYEYFIWQLLGLCFIEYAHLSFSSFGHQLIFEFLLNNKFYYFLCHHISTLVSNVEKIFILFYQISTLINDLDNHWPDLLHGSSLQFWENQR